MTSTYRQVRKDTADRMGDAKSDDPADDKLPCMRCQAPTRRGDLSLYGGRCTACYEALCALPMAAFNARFKTGQPKAALPRREQFVAQGHIGELLAKRPTHDRVRQYAEELGIDIPAEFEGQETGNAPEGAHP